MLAAPPSLRSPSGGGGDSLPLASSPPSPDLAPLLQLCPGEREDMEKGWGREGRGQGVAEGLDGPEGVTQVKTYVNMRVRKVFKWTRISEVHGQRIAPFSEPFPKGRTLNSEFNP